MDILPKTFLTIIALFLLLIACQPQIPLPETEPVLATATNKPLPEATQQPANLPTATSQPTEQATIAPSEQATIVPTQSVPTETAVPPPPQPALDDVITELAGLSLEQFYEESYQQLLLRSPETLTYYGLAQTYGMGNDQMDNLSDAYLRETQELEVAILELLHTYNRDALEAQQQVSYDVYEWYLENQVRGHEFMYHNYPIHHFYGSYNFSLNQLFVESHPLTTQQNVEDYISRLSQVGRQVDQLIEGLHLRAEMGIRPPQVILEMTRSSLLANLQTSSLVPGAVNGRALPLYHRLNDALAEIDTLSEAEKEAYRQATLSEIDNSLIPAYTALIGYIDETLLTATNDAGVWQFDKGSVYYTHLLRQETSTSLTPAEIHQMGLTEVERIQGEMGLIFAELNYPTDETTGALINRAMIDGGFYETTSQSNQEQLVVDLESILADMDQRMQAVFDIQPEGNVVVVGDPSFSGGGYYESAALDGSRPGSYYAGVGGNQVPKFNLQTIAYHEAIPGHHTQVALAQELALPTFRNLLFFNAYGEGWALYSERLAYELDAFEGNPYGNIGRLQLELLRAIRMVVDTGIHAQGWTREEALAYMTDTLGSWTHEVDRYIAWPAQSTGYM